ncbi:MAG: hypothetical protein GY754_07685 [bacterium]|nr:hypothetical protein [bacterium]
MKTNFLYKLKQYIFVLLVTASMVNIVSLPPVYGDGDKAAPTSTTSSTSTATGAATTSEPKIDARAMMRAIGGGPAYAAFVDLEEYMKENFKGESIVDGEFLEVWKKEYSRLSVSELKLYEELNEKLAQRYQRWFGMKQIRLAREAVKAITSIEDPDLRNKRLAETFIEMVKRKAEIYTSIPKEDTLVDRDKVHKNYAFLLALYSTALYEQMNPVLRDSSHAMYRALESNGPSDAALKYMLDLAELSVVGINKAQRETKEISYGHQLRRDIEFNEQKRAGSAAIMKTVYVNQEYFPLPSGGSFTASYKHAHPAGKEPIFTDPSFLSTTTSAKGAAPFNQNSNVVLHVKKIPKKFNKIVNIGPLSAYPEENEYLIAPDTRFKVKQVYVTKRVPAKARSNPEADDDTEGGKWQFHLELEFVMDEEDKPEPWWHKWSWLRWLKR